MILDSPIITGSLIQQAGQFAEIPRYTDVSSSFLVVSASLNAKINALNTDTGSQASRLSNLETKSSSVDISITNLNSFTSSANGRLTNLETTSGSVNTSITSINSSITNINSFTASNGNASINSFTQSFSSSVATSFSSSNASITSLSASVASVTGDFSSSVATSFSQSNSTVTTLSSSVNTRINGLASFTGSYATTGSNTFYGNQIVSASVYVQGNLVVLGTSSMQNITGSSVNIGTNTIVLNTSNPAVRFGGISVQDSGSGAGTSGSLFWDSLNNNWIYQYPSGGAESGISAKLISGPQNTGSLGNEQGLTTGKIVYALGDDYIGDSIMTQTTDKITLSGDLDVTSNISSSTLSGIGNVTNFSQSVNTRFAGLSNATSSYETTGRGIISSSAQLPTGVISGSSQLTSSYDTRYVVSGSITQTTWDNIASKPAGIISGSEQVTGSLDFRYRLVGTGITFAELTGKPTLVSGSSQFLSLSAPFTGSFTGSFKGDGSLLTGLTAGGKIHTQTTPASTWTFTHNLNVQYPNVTVYSTAGQVVLPQSITATDTNTLTLEFGTNVAGYAVAGIGGIIEVQGRTVKQNFTSSLSWRFEHNFGDRFVNIQTFDSNYEKIIPQTIVLTDNTSSLITFPEAESGWAVGTIGGDLPSISSAESGYVLQVSNTSPYTASWTPVANVTVTNALTASHLNPISQSLVPAISGTYDLGSVNKPWRHIYVGTGSIFLVDDKGQTTRTITAQTIVTTDTLNSGSISLINSLPTGTVSGSLQVVDILTSLNTATASFSPRILNLETKSASVDISITNINSITASNIARLTNIENRTGSFATTGSNTFIGTQIISGSTYVQGDLVVLGSSSIQYISASSVSIGTNVVQLNVATPAIRYAGITVQDSGSATGVTGSILWDSLCNMWIYSNPSGVGYSGGMLLSGPRTQTLGTETTLTCNYIAKSGGGDHLYDSCIIDDGTTTCIKNNLVGTGTMSGTTIFGSTIACSPIGCFATSCATSFIGGTMSGTTIYGSTAVCSPVGKFTTCIDAGSGTFSGNIITTGAYAEFQANGSGSSSTVGGSSRFTILDSSNNRGWILQQNASYNLSFWHNNSGWSNVINFTPAGAATFSSSVTLSASNGTLDVGGEAYIRGNGSAYKTHEFTTGASNVAIYHQRNASGTIINKIDTNGVSYFNGGNVGVGTTSPSSLLNTYSATTATQIIITGADTTNQRLEVTDGTVTNRFGIFGRTSGDVGTIGTQTNHSLVFNTNNTERMRITSGGIVTTPYQVSFKAYLSGSNPSITKGAFITIPYNTEEYDNQGNFSTSTYRFTAPVAGKYLFTVNTNMYGTDVAASIRLALFINSTSYRNLFWRQAMAAGNTGDIEISGSDILNLAAGNTVEVRVYSSGSGTYNLSGAIDYNSFSGHLLG